MVLATQTLLQRDPKTYEVRVDGRLAPGRQRQGHHPRPDRPDRHRRRHGPRLRVPRRGHPRPDDGTADDDLQHEHRGRRAGRPHRPGRHDVPVPPRPARTPRLGAAWDAAVERWRTLPTDDGATFDKTDHHRRRTRSSRWSPTARTRAWASRSRATSRRRPTRPTRAAPGARAGPRVHGPPARPGDPRPEGRRRLRRQLHERPDQRPAARRRRPEGPPRRRRRPADGRARLATR